MMNIFSNHASHITRQRSPLQLTLAAATIAALFGTSTAVAEPMFQQSIMPRPDNARWTDNYIEVGAGGVKTDSPNGKAFKFGEFTGLKNEETFGILGLNWIFQSREDDALNFRIHAQDLALDTRKLSLEGGRQGAWETSFSANRLLRAEISPAKFLYAPGSLGTNYVQNIQPRPTNDAGRTAFFLNQANYSAFDIEQGRDIFRLGVKGVLSTNWNLKVDYREDIRDGSRLTGVYFNSAGAGGTGRNPVIVPYQIDDKTQQVDLTLGYLSKAFEAQVAYSYSRYENNLDRFNVDNVNTTAATPATSLSSPVNPTTAGALPIAQVSLAPDNEFHQVTATGAYNFTRDTRAKVQLSYGVALQNETFLPYNSFGAGVTSGVALPRSSLDAKVINTVADISLMTRPTELMDLKIGYQYRDIDNQTPRNTYLYAGRDGAQPAQPVPPASSSFERTNAPMSTTEQRATLDADYRLGSATHLRGLFEHTITDYTLADVSQTKTNKAAVDLRRTFSDEFIGNLGYIFTQRTGTTYDRNVYFRETYTPTYVASASGLLTNHPSMRPFMFNDFDEHRLRTSGNWVVSETLTLGASIDGYDRKYKGNDCDQSFAPTNLALPDTCLGTRNSLGGNATLDVQMQPDEYLLFFGFLTLGHSETEIDQREWTVKNNTAAQGLQDQARNWSATLAYTDQTAGIGSKWQLTPKLEVGGQYVYSVGNGATEFTKAFAPAAASMPDTESKLQTIDIYAKWAYSSRLIFRINYLYENMKITDWSYDQFSSPTTNNGILLTGQSSPNYENHVIGASIAISTW